MALGVGSAALAPAEKFAHKAELEQTLADKQRMLQESQSGLQNTDESMDHIDTVTSEALPGAQTVSFSANSGTTEAAAPEETERSEKPEFKYADPDLTNAAKVSTDGVLMIGDSIMLDASEDIKHELPDCYIDAVQSRQVYTCIEVAQDLINEGLLNQTVVISLGTNGEIEESVARQILDEFGPEISIFWVNLFGRTVLWEKEANQLLLKLADEYPNLSIINWCDLIKPHPEWLWEDGEHPNLEGSVIYATLIRESLEAAAANQKETAAV